MKLPQLVITYTDGTVEHIDPKSAAEWHEEDHPRDEKGQFADAGGASVIGRGTGETFRRYPGGVKPPPPPQRSQRVVEPPPMGVRPPHERTRVEDADRAPDVTSDGTRIDTLETPATIEGTQHFHGGGINESIEVSNGGHYLFKPIAGEHFGGRRGAIDNEEMTLAEREVVASRISKELGIGNVPNTVMAEYHGRQGAAQDWVSNAHEVDGYMSRINPAEQARMGILDAVLGNLDRHKGNALIDRQGHLHAIDHGFSLGKTYPKGKGGPDAHNDIRTFALDFRRGVLSKEEQSAIAEKLSNFNYAKVLHGSHIDVGERDALQARIEKVAERLAVGEAHLIQTDFQVDAW